MYPGEVTPAPTTSGPILPGTPNPTGTPGGEGNNTPAPTTVYPGEVTPAPTQISPGGTPE